MTPVSDTSTADAESTPGSTPELTPVLNGIPAPGNTFVLPDAKMIYVSVTKVACTSLRWMVADLAGEDLESFYDAPAAHQTRLMTIHRDRQFWKVTPQLFKIPQSERGPLSRDNGWFIFAVVRDPWTRLWSGWQSKFLVRHPFYLRNYGDEPWYPREVTSQEQVIEDFTRFVDEAPWLTNEILKTDVHFKTQAYSVRPKGINYTKIYDLDRLSELFDDIHTHLEGLDMDKELYLPRANETPLPLIKPVMTDHVLNRIEETYAEDFEFFGDRWSRDRIKFKGESWSKDALEHAAYHGIANQRIGDMEASTRAMRRQIDRQEKKIAQLKERNAELYRRTPRGVARKVYRKIRTLG